MLPLKLNLFLFHRDLRLFDNQGLLAALKSGVPVLPCFIFDPRQADHSYFSEAGFAFMLESLEELEAEIRSLGGRLYFFEGDPVAVLGELSRKIPLQEIYFNRDYTPFARERDGKIREALEERGVAVRAFEDSLLNAPETIQGGGGEPYKVFTPYYKKARIVRVAPPREIPEGSFFSLSMEGEITLQSKKKQLTKQRLSGGRRAGLLLLENLVNLGDYEKNRDFPVEDGTSRLSAHLKFGTLSIREVYERLVHLFGGSHPLIRQLYWRDFFTQIATFFPYVFGKEFYPKYQTLRWQKNETLLSAWQAGQTGFPMVDAGMRELNATGYMHGRLRMITASFLVKDLHQDWREGERYFASRLRDYDPALNNGNWQWAASTGADAQPYFRIFNPWLQQKRFDPEALYIKKWVPELLEKSPAWIHKIFLHKESIPGYPLPIVEHKEAADYSKAFYRQTGKFSGK